jgi:hypothetical protein
MNLQEFNNITLVKIKEHIYALQLQEARQVQKEQEERQEQEHKQECRR